MRCKLSDKCDFGDLCKYATRHDSITVLGCSSFKAKEQLTNEQYIHSLNMEQLAEYLADKFNEVVDFVLHEVDENAGDVEHDDYWYRQSVVAEWLKQPHTNS